MTRPSRRLFSLNSVAQLWYFVKCIYFGLSAYQIRCGYPTRILGNFLTKKYNHLNLFLFQGYGTGPRGPPGTPRVPYQRPVPVSPQVPPRALPGGAAGRHGLGVDRHHTVPLQLDVCGGHLRQHLHHQVQPGDGEGTAPVPGRVPPSAPCFLGSPRAHPTPCAVSPRPRNTPSPRGRRRRRW